MVLRNLKFLSFQIRHNFTANTPLGLQNVSLRVTKHKVTKMMSSLIIRGRISQNTLSRSAAAAAPFPFLLSGKGRGSTRSFTSSPSSEVAFSSFDQHNVIGHCQRRFCSSSSSSSSAIGRVIRIGDSNSSSTVFSADAIAAFAGIVGDNNPIHLSTRAAEAAGFYKHGKQGGERAKAAAADNGKDNEGVVAHGTLSIGLISNVLGTQLPGPQTIYLQQKTEFVAPVYAGERVTATVTVKEFNKAKHLMWLDTVVTKEVAAASKEGVNKDGGVSSSSPSSSIVVIKGYALAMNKTVSFEGESEWNFKR